MNEFKLMRKFSFFFHSIEKEQENKKQKTKQEWKSKFLQMKSWTC